MKRKDLLETSNAMYRDSMSPEYRLNSCTAWYKIIKQGNYNYTILKSYNTIVALYSNRSGNLYVYNYYSNTTSQHVSKFIDKMCPSRVIYLYERSDKVIEWDCVACKVIRNNKVIRKNLEDCDYSIVIETIAI